MAKRFRCRDSAREDLVQEGQIGLLLAIDRYDPSRGTRFSTYAAFWMRAYMLRYLERHRSQVQGGEERRGVMCDLPLDTPIAFDSETLHLDRLVDDSSDPETNCARNEERRQLSETLERLRGRLGPVGWDILVSRWVQDSPETLESLGKRWGVSREWVRQLENRAKVLLTRHLEAQAA